MRIDAILIQQALGTLLLQRLSLGIYEKGLVLHNMGAVE
jgi:hypothetical protein